MITQQKIKIFNSYNGDIDRWARSGSKKEKSIIEDEDWYAIEGFLQDLALVNKKLASDDFDSNTRKRLAEQCDSLETVQLLMQMADKRH